MMKSPILFIIFKREETTRKVFKRIREAQPSKLYIAADGPRKEKVGEIEQCKRTRAIVDNIDWPCEVYKLFHIENQGCGKGVSSAITWFFEHENEGIILEDDIVPHIDFFKYCDEMLERFRNDDRIQMICGHNSFFCESINKSYYLSSYMQIWGWATWKRVWDTYQLDTALLNKDDFLQKLKKRVSYKSYLYYKYTFNLMRRHLIDTWDYQLFYNQIIYQRYSIISYINQTHNIGFNSLDAAHTTGENINEERNIAKSIYPVNHPSIICEDKESDYINMINTNQFLSSHISVFILELKRNVKIILQRMRLYEKLIYLFNRL